MLTLYRPGDGPWQRLPAGPKAAVLLVVVLGVCLLPASYAAAVSSATVCLVCYAAPGVGWRELGRQVCSVRWVLVITAAAQLLVLGPEDAVANTTRVAAAVLLSGLLTLTTPAGELLDALERALRPLSLLRVDPQRAALVLTVTLNTIPVLAGLLRDVREAQRVRGGGNGLRHVAMPLLVLALKHADALGDALTARGVR